MKVAIVGAGSVGSALAEGLRRAGHDVVLAVRDSTRRGGLPVPTRAVRGAADDADVTVLAVPVDAAAEALAELAPPEGTVIVDATNPFGRLVPGGHASGAALVAATVPRCRVVKAFNVLGYENMTDPVFDDRHRALLPVAGDDAEARDRVVELASSAGFDAVDVGGLEAAPLLEEAARYWGLLAYSGGLGRRFALGALRREGGGTP